LTYNEDIRPQDGSCPTDTEDLDGPVSPAYSGIISPEILTDEVESRLAAKDWNYPGVPIRYHVRSGGTFEEKAECQYKVLCIPPVTCYLKVWLRFQLKSYPYDYVGDTIVHEFEFTGNPCYADATRFELLQEFEGGPTYRVPYFESEFFTPPDAEFYEGSFRGNEELQILKYSYIRGYEPSLSDPSKPSGFPNPYWGGSAP